MFVQGAFIAYQLGAGGGKQTLREYLQTWGLLEDASEHTQARDDNSGINAEAAIAKAEDILAKARKNQQEPK